MSLLIELQYLPPVQYFAKFAQYESVLLEQKENYTKGSYRNRCYIAGANGVLLLSIPLEKGKNEQQNIRQTRIANDKGLWQNQHWRAIRSAYGNSPFFDYYADGLESFYKKEYEYLFDFSLDLLKWLLEKLRLETTIKFTETYEKEVAGNIADWRNGIHPKKHRQRKDPDFEAAYYAQAFEDRHGFLPNLSILDLLFCTGPQAGMVLEECLVSKNKSK
ncbi:MAG: WbqC family protein [Saprospiraceae bacterium]